MMQILFLSRWFPYPADNGSRIRIFNLLAALGAVYTVDLIAFADRPVEAAQRTALLAHCRTVESIPYGGRNRGGVRGAGQWLHRRPRSMVDTHSPALVRAVEQACARNRYDLVIASQVDTIPYAARVPHTPLLLEELEVARILEQAERADSPSLRLRAALTRWKLTGYLQRALPRFAAITVVSAREARLVRTLAPRYGGDVVVLPNGVTPLPQAPAQAARSAARAFTLAYTGAVTYDANLDAVTFFAQEVLPLVRAALPEVRFLVTGATGGVDIAPLQSLGVEFTGYVPEMSRVLAEVDCCVAPLRLGGGTRIKILEAMAAGVPVVASTKGAEGLALRDGRDLLLADAPADLAAAIVRLARDPALREALRAQGRVAVAPYAWDAIGVELLALVERTVATHPVLPRGQPEAVA